MHNIGLKDGRINLAGQTYNTLQLTSLKAERNLYVLASGKIDDLKCVFEFPKRLDRVCISTASSTKLSGVPDESIDYIFVDPPFGDNIVCMPNLVSFTKVGSKTSQTNRRRRSSPLLNGKLLSEYQTLIEECLKELYRVIKPGRWITVAFHNSKNSGLERYPGGDRAGWVRYC